MSESEIVEAYRRRFGVGGRNDVESMRVGGRTVIVKVDTLVYDTDVPPGMTAAEAAKKAAVACVSDFASKGVQPRWALVSVTAPPSWGIQTHEEMAAGLAGAAGEYGFAILGGDTNRGSDTSVTVCMMGMMDTTVPERTIPSRGGAAPGDEVYVSGPFGPAAAGLYCALNGVRCPPGWRDAVMRPRAPLVFGVRAAPHFSASMDSSDGLSTTLNELAACSGVRIVVDGHPGDEGVQEFAAQYNLCGDNLVYNGGEEYEIVFTMRPGAVGAVADIMADVGTPARRIGYVEEGEGVYLKRRGMVPLPDGGWKAF